MAASKLSIKKFGLNFVKFINKNVNDEDFKLFLNDYSTVSVRIL